jgi:hypothetical protein
LYQKLIETDKSLSKIFRRDEIAERKLVGLERIIFRLKEKYGEYYQLSQDILSILRQYALKADEILIFS